MVGRLYHLPRRSRGERAVDVLERFGLADAANRPAKTYSGGMRRRLDLARQPRGAGPDVLFLDEPTTGLDPRSRHRPLGHDRGAGQRGHDDAADHAVPGGGRQLADRIAVIDLGTVIAEGTSDELKDQRRRRGARAPHRRRSRDRAAAMETCVGSAPASRSQDERRAACGSLWAPTGRAALLDAVRRLDAAGSSSADVALHRPTLDDVFLSLTGHARRGWRAERRRPARPHGARSTT